MAVDPIGGSNVVTGGGSTSEAREAQLWRLEEEMRRIQREVQEAQRKAEQARTEAAIQAARAAQEHLRTQLGALSNKVATFEGTRQGPASVGERNRVADLQQSISTGRTSVTAALQKLDQVVVAAAPRTTGNRFFDDELNGAAASGPPAGSATYRVDPRGGLVPDGEAPGGAAAPSGPSAASPASVTSPVEQRLERQYDALSPADKQRISRADFIAQGSEDHTVAAQAHAHADRDIDAQIAAAIDLAGPGSAEARALRAQRERLIEVQVRAAMQDHRTTRDAAALAGEYAQNPARWAEVAGQMGLDPTSPPDAAAIEEFLRMGQRVDAQARIDGQIAMNNVPAGATAADREAARVEAETRSRLEAMVAQGRVEVPAGADAQAWAAGQAELAGAAERERQQALDAGLDPNQAVAQSGRLFEMQLDAALDSGAVELDGATPEQVAEWKAREVSRFNEAVALANQNGMSLAEARERIQLAYAVLDRRVDTQLQINGMAEAYNDSSTAVTRGGTFLLDSAFGDGMNNLEWAQQEVAAIETLEREYQRMLLDATKPMDAARRAELEGMRAEIDQRLTAVQERAGGDFQASMGRAHFMSYVETGLFTVVYTGSAVLGPLGLVTGGITKAFLQDLPNGQIRNDGNWLETAGDLAVSGALGVGEVALNRIPGAQGWAGVAVDMAANGGYGVISNVVAQARAENPEGIDWQQVAYTGALSAGGSFLGGVAARPLGRFGGEGAQQLGRLETGLFDAATQFSVGSMMNAAGQYTTTGQVDFWQAIDGGIHGIVSSVAAVPSAAPAQPTPADAPPADAPPDALALSGPDSLADADGPIVGDPVATAADSTVVPHSASPTGADPVTANPATANPAAVADLHASPQALPPSTPSLEPPAVVEGTPSVAPSVRAGETAPSEVVPFSMPDLPQGIASPHGMQALDSLLASGATPTYNQAVHWRDDIRAALDTRTLGPEARARLEGAHGELNGVIADYRAQGASGPIENPLNALGSVERAHEAGIQTDIDRLVEAGRFPNGIDPEFLARRQREGLAKVDPASVLSPEDRSIPADWVNSQDYLTRRAWDQYFDFAGIHQVPAVHGTREGVVGQGRPSEAGPMEFIPLEMDTYLAAIDQDPRLQNQELLLSVSCYGSYQPDGGPSIAQAVAQHTQKPVLSSMDKVYLSTREDGVRVWASEGPWTLTHPDGRVETLSKAQVAEYPFVRYWTWSQ